MPPPQDRRNFRVCPCQLGADSRKRLRSGSAGGSRGWEERRRGERGGSRGAAPGTSAGAQPGRPRVPPNPMTQQIMAGEAGFLLLPPLPGGRAGRRRVTPAATDPSPPATRVARGREGGSHLPSSTRSAYRRSPLDGQPAPPLTSVSGLAPPTSAGSASVRAKEGRRARGAWREPRGAGAPTLGVPRDLGPRAL